MDTSIVEIVNAVHEGLSVLLWVALAFIALIAVLALGISVIHFTYEWCENKFGQKSVSLDAVGEDIIQMLYISDKPQNLTQITKYLELTEQKVLQALMLLIRDGYVTVHDFNGNQTQNIDVLSQRTEDYFKLSKDLNYYIAEFDVQKVFTNEGSMTN